MVINNQKEPTERRQFLEQNGTQDCDISLDPEIKLDCCEFIRLEIIEGIHGWDGNPRPGNPCDWFYKCDKNNFHCVINSFGIIVTCILILLTLVLVCMVCYIIRDWIRRKVNNLFSNFPLISGRTEANSMEMKE